MTAFPGAAPATEMMGQVTAGSGGSAFEMYCGSWQFLVRPAASGVNLLKSRSARARA